MIIDVRIYDQWWITCIYIFYITYIWHITYIEIQYIYMYMCTYRNDKCCMHDICVYVYSHVWFITFYVCLRPGRTHLYTACLRPPCRRRNTSREKISAAASCWWACSSSPWPAGDKTGAPGGSTNAERIRIDDGKNAKTWEFHGISNTIIVQHWWHGDVWNGWWRVYEIRKLRADLDISQPYALMKPLNFHMIW